MHHGDNLNIVAFVSALELCGLPNEMVSLDMDSSAWVFLTKHEGTFLRSLDRGKWEIIFGESGLPFPRQSLLKKLIWEMERYVPR